MKTATTGVLFIKALRAATGTMSRKRACKGERGRPSKGWMIQPTMTFRAPSGQRSTSGAVTLSRYATGVSRRAEGPRSVP